MRALRIGLGRERLYREKMMRSHVSIFLKTEQRTIDVKYEPIVEMDALNIFYFKKDCLEKIVYSFILFLLFSVCLVHFIHSLLLHYQKYITAIIIMEIRITKLTFSCLVVKKFLNVMQYKSKRV